MGRHKRYCIFGCDVELLKSVPLHRFPHPERRSELYAAWMSAVGHKLTHTDGIKIHKTKRVCDQHFEPNQKTCSNRLIWSAVPSINLERVRQSIVSIVEIDHDYSYPRREWDLRPMASTTNTPGSSTSTSSSMVKSTNTAKGTEKEDSVEDEKTTVAIDEPCGDSYKDENVTNTPVPESDELPQELFSWEKDDTIIADDIMVGTVEAPDLTLDFGDVSMYNDDHSSKDDHIGSQSLDYLCNKCGETITGFRYTCVQCADWDLCGACEARAAHDTHYVLRVPGQRPYKEVQAILTAVRQHMLSENMFLPEMIASVKEEVKDDETEVLEGAPEPEGDPLGAWNASRHDDDCDTLENNQDCDPNKDAHSPQSRRRTTLDSLANTQNLIPRDDSSYSYLTDDELMETDNDGTRSDDGETCDTRFDYSESIEIIDVDKLTRTHEQTKQDSDMYTDIIQITKENGIEMLASRLEDILDTYKPKVQHTVQKKLVDMSSLETPLKTLKHTSHINDETHNERIRKQSKEIATHTKGTGAHSEGTGTLSQTKIGTQNKRIVSRSTANTNRRYKILLPPGDQWKKLLMTMLKTRVTVQLVDLMDIVRRLKERNK